MLKAPVQLAVPTNQNRLKLWSPATFPKCSNLGCLGLGACPRALLVPDGRGECSPFVFPVFGRLSHLRIVQAFTTISESNYFTTFLCVYVCVNLRDISKHCPRHAPVDEPMLLSVPVIYIVSRPNVDQLRVPSASADTLKYYVFLLLL